jgi:hypothetical protein
MCPQKYNPESISQTIPIIKKLIKSSNSKKELKGAVRQLKSKEIDGVCSCADIGLSAIKKENLDSNTLSKLAAHKDGLRFLARYARCPREKKRNLRKRRNKTLVQSGQGLGVLLSILAPILTTVISRLVK